MATLVALDEEFSEVVTFSVVAVEFGAVGAVTFSTVEVEFGAVGVVTFSAVVVEFGIMLIVGIGGTFNVSDEVLEADAFADGAETFEEGVGAGAVADTFEEAADPFDGVATDDEFEFSGGDAEALAGGPEELFGARDGGAEELDPVVELFVDASGVEEFPASVVVGAFDGRGDGISVGFEVLVIVVLDRLLGGLLVLDRLAEVLLSVFFPLNSAFNSFCSGVSVSSVFEMVLLDMFEEVFTAGAEAFDCGSEVLEKLEDTLKMLTEALVPLPAAPVVLAAVPVVLAVVFATVIELLVDACCEAFDAAVALLEEFAALAAADELEALDPSAVGPPVVEVLDVGRIPLDTTILSPPLLAGPMLVLQPAHTKKSTVVVVVVGGAAMQRTPIMFKSIKALLKSIPERRSASLLPGSEALTLRSNVLPLCLSSSKCSPTSFFSAFFVFAVGLNPLDVFEAPVAKLASPGSLAAVKPIDFRFCSQPGALTSRSTDGNPILA